MHFLHANCWKCDWNFLRKGKLASAWISAQSWIKHIHLSPSEELLWQLPNKFKSDSLAFAYNWSQYSCEGHFCFHSLRWWTLHSWSRQQVSLHHMGIVFSSAWRLPLYERVVWEQACNQTLSNGTWGKRKRLSGSFLVTMKEWSLWECFTVFLIFLFRMQDLMFAVWQSFLFTW